jgi:hypothetical protein
MPKLTEKTLVENLDFKCARCQADCTKLDATEPELGYISHAPGHEGEFVGPLCKACYNEVPDKDKTIKRLPETAFLVVVRQNGEGAYMTTEDISMLYMRDPNFNDIITACDSVSRNVKESVFAQKIIGQFMSVLRPAQKKSNLVVPK